MEIQIGVYFDVTTGREEAEARESPLLGCLRLAEGPRIELAVPTRKAHPIPDGEAAGPTLTLHADPDGEDEKQRAASA